MGCLKLWLCSTCLDPQVDLTGEYYQDIKVREMYLLFEVMDVDQALASIIM